MLRTRLSVILVGAALLASACRDLPLTGPDSDEATPALGRASPLQGGSLSVVSQLDRAVPGFGGFFLDELERPTVLLTAGVDRGPAMSALRAELRRLGIQGEVRVLPASYLWRDLDRWHDLVSPVALAIDGVYWTDADESANRVRVGVADFLAMTRVRSEIAALGVPAGAVLVEPSWPVIAVATLRQEVRPVVGGVQIHFQSGASNFLCSLGFNAHVGGQASFITTSHCTATQGGEEGTDYWQPSSVVSPTAIGEEADDPDYTGGGDCPSGRVCRQSDAARVSYVNSTTNTLGSIARTATFRGRQLEIVGSWSITAADDATDEFVIGTVLNKVGRTTGWSQGAVAGTCIDSNVAGSDITLFCQTFVKARVGAGDSGASVFAITNAGTFQVTLVGLLWGSAGPWFIFSPLKNIEAELGNLTVFP